MPSVLSSWVTIWRRRLPVGRCSLEALPGGRVRIDAQHYRTAGEVPNVSVTSCQPACSQPEGSVVS
jgi:hypothetical protein